MTAPASAPVVNLNDHLAAAAYLMKHAGATALVALDGQWPGRPAGSSPRPTSPGQRRPARTWTMSGSATCSPRAGRSKR